MNHYDGEILVERIRRICRDKGISIAQMEKDLNWSQGLISRWTKNSPSVGKIMEVVNYLGISYEELLGESESGEAKNKEELFAQKLYHLTELERLEWELCDESFGNDDVQEFLKQDAHKLDKVYRAPYEEGFFLLIVEYSKMETIRIGVLRNIIGRIRYPDQDGEMWLEKILELIDQDEYEKWDKVRTEDYIKQFMQADFN